jgi:hypothetical protein
MIAIRRRHYPGRTPAIKLLRPKPLEATNISQGTCVAKGAIQSSSMSRLGGGMKSGSVAEANERRSCKGWVCVSHDIAKQRRHGRDRLAIRLAPHYSFLYPLPVSPLLTVVLNFPWIQWLISGAVSLLGLEKEKTVGEPGVTFNFLPGR